MPNLDSILKGWNITLPTKVHLVKAMVFPVVMYGCETWTIKKAECWRIDSFELWCWRRLFESPLDYKEIQPVHPKGDQSWIFIGRTDAETSIIWPPDAKSWLIGEHPDAGKDWQQEKKQATEEEKFGWNRPLDRNLNKLWKIVKDREVWLTAVQGIARVRREWVTEQRLNDAFETYY